MNWTLHGSPTDLVELNCLPLAESRKCMRLSLSEVEWLSYCYYSNWIRRDSQLIIRSLGIMLFTAFRYRGNWASSGRLYSCDTLDVNKSLSKYAEGRQTHFSSWGPFFVEHGDWVVFLRFEVQGPLHRVERAADVPPIESASSGSISLWIKSHAMHACLRQ